ncbi:MAG: DinB family protein [Dehalococcoidia bacterium]|nr:DinB family protein [Dehalococcoidia bacterium]
MANRQALEGAFKAADARLERMLPLMTSYADDRLLDDGGKWTVRDCLCHVAASARVSGMGQRALARLEGNAPAPAPGAPTVDERNQEQIASRATRSVREIVDETREAHAAAWADIVAMTDATLDTKVPDMYPWRPPLSVGGIILRTLENHEGGQLDRIEAALKSRTRWL